MGSKAPRQVFKNGQAMIFAQWPNTLLDLSHPTVAYAQGGGGGLLTESAQRQDEFTIDGQVFHSAHYNVGGGKRDDTRLYETGRFLSKLALSGSAATADQAEAAAGD